MADFPVAIQLYSVRDEAGADLEGTLRNLKAMGYDGVEFWSGLDYSYDQLKASCEKTGMIPLSAHVSLEQLLEDPEILAGYKSVGCSYVAISSMGQPYHPGHEKFDEMVAAAIMLGRKAKELGMTLCYHNHHTEFARVNGEYELDCIYDAIPADLLSTQIDTCWVNAGGVEPAAYIRKYAGRVEVVHLKDSVGILGQKDFELRPVGYGSLDMVNILKTAKETGAKWLIVEQDEPSMGKSALECADLSVRYLKTVC